MSQPLTDTLADLPDRPRHPVNVAHHEGLSIGQRAADVFTGTLGSWRFVIIQSCLLSAWVVLNTIALIAHWDPYPYILLNLALSFQAAYAAPIIMMSQNRQAAKDRDLLDHTYADAELLKELLARNTEITESIHRLTTEIHGWREGLTRGDESAR